MGNDNFMLEIFFVLIFCQLQNSHRPFSVYIAVKSKASRIPMLLDEFCVKLLGKIYERKPPVHEQNYNPFGARTRASTI